MSRPTSKVFSIELDRPRQLQYNLLAQMRFQDQRGRNIVAALRPVLELISGFDADADPMKMMAEALSVINPGDVAAVVWCGLGKSDPDKPARWIPDDDLTLEDVAGMLDFPKLTEIWKELTGAVSDAHQKADADTARPTEEATETTDPSIT
ncbi:MAG TPA: hypothetical protein VMX97_04300 [Hyphomicrobiaceae bacterium]|nr:hypothetical protein [Hyphomicrobiaceae bacterium]